MLQRRTTSRGPACCWSNWYGMISCFRLMWCALPLQWGRLLYQHPVPIYPSLQRGGVNGVRVTVLRDGIVGRDRWGRVGTGIMFIPVSLFRFYLVPFLRYVLRRTCYWDLGDGWFKLKWHHSIDRIIHIGRRSYSSSIATMAISCIVSEMKQSKIVSFHTTFYHPRGNGLRIF